MIERRVPAVIVVHAHRGDREFYQPWEHKHQWNYPKQMDAVERAKHEWPESSYPPAKATGQSNGRPPNGSPNVHGGAESNKARE